MQVFAQRSGQHGHHGALAHVVLARNALGHDGRDGRRRGGTVGLAPADEGLGFDLEGQARHRGAIVGWLVKLGQMEAILITGQLLELLDVGLDFGEVGVVQLRLIVGNRLGDDSRGVVFRAVLQAHVVVERGLDEAVETQAIAEAMEHGKVQLLARVGHINHVVIGRCATHHTRALVLGNLKGKVVLGIVIEPPLAHHCPAIVGHANEGLVHCLLQQIAAHILGQVELDDVAPLDPLAVAEVCAIRSPLDDLKFWCRAPLCHSISLVR